MIDFKNSFHELNGEYFRGNVSQNGEGELIILIDCKEMALTDLGEFLKPMDEFRIEVIK